ncbi:hypothetical protein DPMN_038473 [Dreissena polymorpha]|uniref:Uncharacterized protein n=1 Tax=Dreissena polymorpha TaxID=45954 RepID=A0A9D4MD66_DREPO|nr:hypothetical protein DPMN_038473 [Dreissena polymorpha]
MHSASSSKSAGTTLYVHAFSPFFQERRDNTLRTCIQPLPFDRDNTLRICIQPLPFDRDNTLHICIQPLLPRAQGQHFTYMHSAPSSKSAGTTLYVHAFSPFLLTGTTLYVYAFNPFLLTGTTLYVYAFSPFFQERSSYDKLTYKFPSGVHPALARYSVSTERLDRGSNNLSMMTSSSN